MNVKHSTALIAGASTGTGRAIVKLFVAHGANVGFCHYRDPNGAASLIFCCMARQLSTSCRADEHTAIMQAISNKDADEAARLMLEHLDHCESSLNLNVVD